MNGIERANPDTLSGVFSSFDDANWTDKTKLSDERLKDLIEHMSKLKVGNNNYSADVMGDSYEFLIKKFADLSKKNAGEFYTPRSIVKLLIMLLAPKAGETVYDPACGTGGGMGGWHRNSTSRSLFSDGLRCLCSRSHQRMPEAAPYSPRFLS